MHRESLKYNIGVFWTIILCLLYATISKAQTISFASNNSNCFSYITISGKSNVNQFALTWSEPGINNIKNVKEYSTDSAFYRITVPVKDFKTANSFMYEDFIVLMKAEDFPSIIIRIPQYQIDKIKSGEYFYNMKILITIAGISKLYEVPCYIMNCTEKTLYVNGVKNIHFTDFDMAPPVMLQGLVKVRDEVRVNFGFILTFNNLFPNIASR